MKPMPLSRLAEWTGGRLLGADVLVEALSTDTRTLDARDGAARLFVALQGEHFDGHDHVATAAALGARAALVSRPSDAALPQLVVADSERALAAIAAALQRSRKGKVLAITGSNGKTSVKALLLSILQRAVAARAGTAYANPGNRNNEIGLPLAVIDAPDNADYAVYEMGAGKPGDIAYLAGIARPDVALVNNIAPAHLERMGNLLGIADTKAAIYDALSVDGVAVVNADDAFAPYFAERAKGRRQIRFGLDASADVSARDVHLDGDGARFTLCTPQGDVAIQLALGGRHNVANALAAAAMALGAGVALDDIAAGLAATAGVAGRLATHHLRSGALLVDDSYNANPGSLHAAIDTLAATPGEVWLVLGDMRELGPGALGLHAEAGRRAKGAGIARLYALGELSGAAAEAFGEGARTFATHEEVVQALRGDLSGSAGAVARRDDGEELAAHAAPATSASGTAAAPLRVLVKGSRGSAMERVVKALLSTEGSTHVA